MRLPKYHDQPDPQRLMPNDFVSSFGVVSVGPQPSRVYLVAFSPSTLASVTAACMPLTDAEKQRTPAQFEDVQWIWSLWG